MRARSYFHDALAETNFIIALQKRAAVTKQPTECIFLLLYKLQVSGPLVLSVVQL